MAIINLKPAAQQDLMSIHYYIRNESDSREVANKFLDEITFKLHFLSKSLNSGISKSHLKKSLRSFPIKDYLIFYFPVKKGIEVIRVLHGKRKIRRAHFK